MKFNGSISIIDIHCHIKPDPVLKNRESFLNSEPDFKLLYHDPVSRLSGTGDVLQYMNKQGISRAVLLGFPWRDPALLRLHNDTILSSTATGNGCFFAFPCIYPFGAEAAAETTRCFDGGASGIGEVGLYDRDIDSEYIEVMAPVMRICLERERPLMLHVNEPIGHNYSGKAPVSIKGIYNFVRAYPDNKIILAHWGGGLLFFSSLKKEVKTALKNVWFDSAASPYLYDKTIWKKAVEAVGAEKVLFGTDFPLLTAKRYLDELEQSGLTHDELELILQKNAEGLLCN